MEERFNNNVAFVYKLVKRMAFDSNDYEDLVQAGLMGLLYASRRYDSFYHTPFLSYAAPYILGEIKREIRERNPIKLSREIYSLFKKIKSADKTSIEDIAKENNTTKENVILALDFSPKIISISAFEEDKMELSLENQDERKIVITKAIQELPEEERMLIFNRYYKGYTQNELAIKTGQTQSKISRLEKKALRNLKDIIMNKYSDNK